MQVRNRAMAVLSIAFALATTSAFAVPINSAVPTLGGPAADFEGLPEGTLVTNQYAGLTFGQVDGGTPMVDDSPFLFAYAQSSGEGVLTGTTTGGAPFDTVAGLTITLSSPGTSLEFYLSDIVPIASYTVTAYGDGGVFLESFVIPSTGPIGSYVGFNRPGGDLRTVTVDSDFPDSPLSGDAFAIDDVRFVSRQAPEPGSLLLLGLGLASLGFTRRRRA